jgi:predicted GH43/DUF377 family glycosyl hydrolase
MLWRITSVAVVQHQEGVVFMWKYAIIISLLVVLAASMLDAQAVFVKSPDNPVLPNYYDAVGILAAYKTVVEPSVMYDNETGMFNMWYSAETGGYGARFCIDRSFSLDGIEWYEKIKYRSELATSESGVFDVNLRNPDVLRVGAGYRMYYMGDANGVQKIGVATSADGKSWTKYSGNPILDHGQAGAWDETGGMFFSAMHTDTLDYLWYTGSNAAGVGAIGLATSRDGFTWEKYPNNPVFQVNPTGWDSIGVISPSVVQVNGVYYMFYLGIPVRYCCKSSIGWAYSTDGINWTRGGNAPVVAPASGWEDRSLGGMSVVFANGKFYMYYDALSSTTNYWEIGLAIADYTPLAVIEEKSTIPKLTHLSDSYPNPFNPETTIRFGISKDSHVKLAIYDVLGREVAVLLNDKKTAGEYRANWNAAGFPSGVYFYRLEAGEFTETHKITLLR